MTEEIVQTTSDFLNALIDKGVFKWNTDVFSKNSKKIKQFKIRTFLLGSSFVKISDWTKNQEVLTEDERFVFLYWTAINLAVSNLELCKTILTLFLDPEKIKFKDTTTYGTLIYNICDSIEFDKESREKLFESLYVNFRNIIAHENYDVTRKGIFLYKGKTTYHLDYAGIVNVLNEIKTIFITIRDFVDQLVIELDKQIEKTDKETEETMKKVKEINKKINESESKKS